MFLGNLVTLASYTKSSLMCSDWFACICYVCCYCCRRYEFSVLFGHFHRKKAMNILSYSIKLCVLWTNSSEWNEFKVHILNNIRHKLEHSRFYFELMNVQHILQFQTKVVAATASKIISGKSGQNGTIGHTGIVVVIISYTKWSSILEERLGKSLQISCIGDRRRRATVDTKDEHGSITWQRRSKIGPWSSNTSVRPCGRNWKWRRSCITTANEANSRFASNHQQWTNCGSIVCGRAKPLQTRKYSQYNRPRQSSEPTTGRRENHLLICLNREHSHSILLYIWRWANSVHLSIVLQMVLETNEKISNTIIELLLL